MSTDSTKKIGLGVAVLIGMNAMIGAGIVSMPAVLSSQVGPAGIVSYLIAISFVLGIGLSLAHLAQKYPQEGWSYVYPSRWGGHLVGMIAATAYLAGVLIAMGFLVQQAGVWMQFFFPAVTYKLLGTGVLVALTLLILAGAQASSIAQYVIGACVLGPLVTTSLIGLAGFNPALATPFVPYGTNSIFSAVPKLMFSLIGFESIASMYSIVKNPKKNVPKAFIIAILSVGTLYILFASAILFSIPREFFIKGFEESLASVLSTAFPQYRFLSTLVLFGGLFAILGTLHSMIWSLSSLFTDVLQKAKTKQIKYLFEKGLWTSTTSVFATFITIFLSSIFLKAESILLMVVFSIALSYLLSIMALFLDKKEWVSGRNVVTLFAVLAILLIMFTAAAGLLF